MSWNTVLTFVEGQGAREVLARLPEFSVRRGTISFEEASSVQNDGLAYAEVSGWAVLCHSLALADLELGDRLTSGRVLTLLLGGAGTVYGFSLSEESERVRELIYADFEAVEESGDPLAEEADVSGGEHDEDWLFGLMESVTGLTLDDLLDLPFTLWSKGERS